MSHTDAYRAECDPNTCKGDLFKARLNCVQSLNGEGVPPSMLHRECCAQRKYDHTHSF